MYTQIVITVSTYNDYSPEFVRSSYHVYVHLGVPLGTQILKVEATDEDSLFYNRKLKYNISFVRNIDNRIVKLLSSNINLGKIYSNFQLSIYGSLFSS